MKSSLTYMRMMRQSLLAIAITVMAWTCYALPCSAQELTAKFKINHNAVQGVDRTVFDKLQETLEQFFNEKQWTSLHFKDIEKIPVNFNITVKKLDLSTNAWTCTAIIQATRPVFNSSYTTTIYNNSDQSFDFEFSQFDQLEFNPETIDNQLTALLAYYAYLIIGIDLDTFSPKGGEEVLQMCMNLTNNAQNLDYPGWKAFDSSRNRFAIINDYTDGAMEPFRQLQYDYYRKGLDEMVSNVERGRTEISTAIEQDLKKAHEDRPTSLLPQIWTDYKKDELSRIYLTKGTQKEKETVYDILMGINASQSNSWDKIKQ